MLKPQSRQPTIVSSYITETYQFIRSQFLQNKILLAMIIFATILNVMLGTTNAEQYVFGGRQGTYDLFMANVVKRSNFSSQETIAQTKKYLAQNFNSTWCDILYVNKETGEQLRRREICLVDHKNMKFYSIWDGYNVYQFNTESTPPPNSRQLENGAIDLTGNLPDSYSGQVFVIGNNNYALFVNYQNISSSSIYSRLNNTSTYIIRGNITIFLSSLDAHNNIMKDTRFYFRISNHPSGIGVIIRSMEYGDLCFCQLKRYLTVDKMFEVGLAPCNYTDPYQKFYWTGASIISSVNIDTISAQGLDYTNPTSYALRFFKLTYGHSIGMVKYNERPSSVLTLLLVTSENALKNPYQFKEKHVLTPSTLIESFYINHDVVEQDVTLQNQLARASMPFRYSAASTRTLCIYSNLLLVVIVLVFLLSNFESNH
ncbi:hypothetical protein C9374_008024 [Naegleria lovaniensis]|uniref:Uncharacterized protein n=1 Tax=Naegleria lovaniensis TaxID=51637 RepID=A0AA88GLX8_NAELO|nr:uncharacterized protein C9374_008024 [Naegleria lovaniensis]KAG2378876.1 hypothetical protein C9374_008024 [Naegleria lovaniensis]